MGLIKSVFGALGNSVSSAVADQWKEYFYCDSMDSDTLVIKGVKRVSEKGKNTEGSDNIISNGSGIVVADGQCMLIVEQGKVVEVCAEPGQFTYDTSTEPSIFAGSLGASIIDTFKTIGKRFTYGGDTGKDQRVYYINTKELMDNKFGSPNPIPFRAVDKTIGLNLETAVRCSGVYSYKIANPLLFYTNVCGNITDTYTRENIESQLKTEFISALQPSLGKLSQMEILPSAITAHTEEMSNALNEALSEKWGKIRGLEVVSVAFNPIILPDGIAEKIQELQMTAVMRDPSMAAATLAGAQAEAMKTAAGNDAGAMIGFMGMNMANMAGGASTQNLFAMGQQQQQQQSSPIGGWKCSCGADNSGNFCANCGSKKPESGWKCACGSENKGNFCSNCGAKKPSAKCADCGYIPEDPANPPKFCPNCGNKM